MNAVWYFIFIFIAWGVYRYLFTFPELIEELLIKPVIKIAPIVYIILVLEKAKFLDSINLRFKKVPTDILLGIVCALFTVALLIVSIYIKFGSVKFDFNMAPFGGWGSVIVSSLATAIVEEIAFRGFILFRLEKLMKNSHAANFTTTFFFLLIHLPRQLFLDQMTGREIAGTVPLRAFLSLLEGYIVLYRRNILPSTVSHFLWNILSLVVI